MRLEEAAVDFIEISGGNYETASVSLMRQAGVQSSSTAREAFFLEFAKKVKGSTKNTPIMLTG